METIKFTEKRKSTKLPAIIVTAFLVIGGAFVAYGIKNEELLLKHLSISLS